MTPLVGFAQADVQHARLVPNQMLAGKLHGDHVKSIVGPVARQAPEQVVHRALTFRQWRIVDRFPVGMNLEAVFFRAKDRGKHIPGAKCRHPVAIGRLAVQEFKYGKIGIRLLGVGVDPRVGYAAEHLAVARVGKLEPVGQAGWRLACRVAEDLSFPGHGVPEKRQHRRGTPELLLEPVEVADAAELLVEQRLVGAAKKLLPAKTVERHDNDVFRARGSLLPAGPRRRGQSAECEQRQRHETGLKSHDVDLTPTWFEHTPRPTYTAEKRQVGAAISAAVPTMIPPWPASSRRCQRCLATDGRLSCCCSEKDRLGVSISHSLLRINAGLCGISIAQRQFSLSWDQKSPLRAPIQ